jgi:hypothetical protein
MELTLSTHSRSGGYRRTDQEHGAHQSRYMPQTWPAKLVAYREELRRAVGAIEERRRRRMRA